MRKIHQRENVTVLTQQIEFWISSNWCTKLIWNILRKENTRSVFGEILPSTVGQTVDAVFGRCVPKPDSPVIPTGSYDSAIRRKSTGNKHTTIIQKKFKSTFCSTVLFHTHIVKNTQLISELFIQLWSDVCSMFFLNTPSSVFLP